MKKLFLLTLLVPSLSFGQKIEVSEMGGYSSNMANSFFTKFGSYSNQLSVNYNLCTHTSVGVYHELNVWAPNTNTVGLQADAHFEQFYFGVNTGVLFFEPVNMVEYVVSSTPGTPGTSRSTTAPGYMVQETPVMHKVRVNPAISYGFHIGLNQKLCNHFSIKEQVGYSAAHSTGTYYSSHISEKVNCASALVGIAWHF